MGRVTAGLLCVGVAGSLVAANWDKIEPAWEKFNQPDAAAAPASPSSTVVEGAGQTLTGMTVVVDPGHNRGNVNHTQEISQQVPDGRGGQKDCNTAGTATNDGYSEADFNLAVTSKLRDTLTNMGATVISTADNNPDPYGPCVDERAAIINNAQPDAAISIHADGNETPGNSGYHIIVSGYNPSPASDALAATLNANLQAVPGAHCANPEYIQLEDPAHCIDRRGDLAVPNTTNADIPLVTLESGNMRDADEAARLKDPAFQQQWANAIATSIEQQLTTTG
jgi:N-acetylmuramoyl-L-alanine amidase